MAEDYYALVKGAATEAFSFLVEGDAGVPKNQVGVHPDKFYRSIQKDGYSCGAHSVYMILRHFGKRVSYKETARRVGLTEEGTDVLPIIKTLRYFDLKVGYYPRLRFARLHHLLSRDAVCLVHLDTSHFGVVHGVTSKRVYLADPSYRKMKDNRSLSVTRFKERWSKWALSARK
jgi:ABC-type bacteriocin/lantibiotic exporter with double-glycine peptidase domain